MDLKEYKTNITKLFKEVKKIFKSSELSYNRTENMIWYVIHTNTKWGILSPNELLKLINTKVDFGISAYKDEIAIIPSGSGFL